MLSDAGDGYVIADSIFVVPLGAQPNTATWTPVLPADGNYRVYARWTAHANRASDATYTVHHSSGSSAVVVDQRQSGGEWNLLGTYDLNAGSYVSLNDQANGYVIADGLYFVAESLPERGSLDTGECEVIEEDEDRCFERCVIDQRSDPPTAICNWSTWHGLSGIFQSNRGPMCCSLPIDARIKRD